MTALDIIILAYTIIGPIIAYYLNKADGRKQSLCMIVLAVTGFSFWAFHAFTSAPVLYLFLIGLELAAVGGIYAIFYPPQWKNEGYLLMVCVLMLLSVGNTIAYFATRDFGLYGTMADTLALLTVTWMILRSDGMVSLCRNWFRVGDSRTMRHHG